MNIPPDDIKDFIAYNPVSGLFTRIKRYDGKPNREGDNASRPCGNGYFRVRFRKKSYQAHRLAFWWVNGYMPSEIDHIDGVKWNNRIQNLREASRAGNQRNHSINSRNTSGVKGVTIAKRGPRRYWVCKIITDGALTSKYFPYTDAGLVDAESWIKAQRELKHKEFANHG